MTRTEAEERHKRLAERYPDAYRVAHARKRWGTPYDIVLSVPQHRDSTGRIVKSGRFENASDFDAVYP